MIDVGFFFRGIHSKEIGVELQDRIKISAATPRVEPISIPGRSGDALYYDGGINNRIITAKCYVLSYTLSQDQGAVNAWLLGEDGYHRFISDEDPEHYMMARAQTGAESYSRAGLLNAFTVKFDAKPQRYLLSGDTPISFSNLVTGSTVEIYNPTAFEAAPIITIKGQTNNQLMMLLFNDKSSLSIKRTDIDLTYDADLDTAYHNGTNYNSSIYTPYVIRLKSGANTIKLSSGTITEMTITPRWWEL